MGAGHAADSLKLSDKGAFVENVKDLVDDLACICTCAIGLLTRRGLQEFVAGNQNKKVTKTKVRVTRLRSACYVQYELGSSGEAGEY